MRLFCRIVIIINPVYKFEKFLFRIIRYHFIFHIIHLFLRVNLYMPFRSYNAKIIYIIDSPIISYGLYMM